jgi:AcrR family transcriptional regulator
VSRQSPTVEDRKSVRGDGPRGANEVRAALIAAGAELFAERGPSNVSIRAIAEQARVNHGLVHHYFGSKDALLAAVLDQLAEQAAAEIADGADAAGIYRVGGATEQHGRILAHLLLEARDPSEVQHEFPALDALVGHLRGAGLGNRQARERAASAAALVLGWQLFEPFLVSAARIDRSPRTRQRMLDAGIRKLLE